MMIISIHNWWVRFSEQRSTEGCLVTKGKAEGNEQIFVGSRKETEEEIWKIDEAGNEMFMLILNHNCAQTAKSEHI